MAGIDISKLAAEISKQVEVYANGVQEKVAKASNAVTRDGVKVLKSTSPDLTGDYREGWTRKKEDAGYVIHNKTDYQLTHLLEYGHAKVGGGRISAQVHIRPVEEKVMKDFEDLVKKAIQS